MSVEKKFGGGLAWMAAGNWIEQGINFAVFVLLARILGAEAFGLLAMAAAFVLFCEFLVRESLSDFLISVEDLKAEHLNATFWMLVGLGAVLWAGLVSVAGPVASMFGEPQVSSLIVLIAPTVLMISLTAVPVAILRRDMRFATLSLRAVAGVVVGGIVAVTMALNGYGVWSLAGQRLAQVLTNIVMAWAAVTWRPRLSFSAPHGREVLHFGSTVLGLRAAELAATQVPSVIIGATHGPAVLGLFAIAWRLVEIGSFLIVTPLRMTSQPAFAAIRRSGENAANLLIDISKLSGPVAMAAFAGIAVLAAPVTGVLFGEEWIGSAPVLSVLSVFGAYLCIEKINQAFCLAAGRAGATTIIAWFEVGLAAFLVWLAAPLGLVAMSAAMVVSFLVFWPFRFAIIARIAGTDAVTLVRVHVKPLVLISIMAAIVWFVAVAMDGFSDRWIVFVGAVSGLIFMAVAMVLTMGDRIKVLRRFVGKPENSDGEPQ